MDRQEHRVERRLAAIFAADVAGYSRLMEQDEIGTLHTLMAYREIMDRLITEHGGRIANTAGDSVLAEFHSAVDAVQCAVEVQNALAMTNQNVPEECRLHFRIGVHVGDVMVQGDDLLGDGVNIAARLEGLADPGGICISEATYGYVRKTLPLTFTDLGLQTVKNIAEPVRAYRISTYGIGEHTQSAKQSGTPSRSDKPTIVVLPFTNLGGDPAQQYFSNGITEDVVTDLSHYRELAIRASSLPLEQREKSFDVQRLGHDLGVQYIVQGSVRRVGDRVRITVQLMDTASGEHLWSERFDRPIEDIFAVQDEMVHTIVGTLVGRLEAAGAERAKRKPPRSLAAYECVLRGKALPIGDTEAEVEARRLYKRAIALDPDYAQAHALLAHMLALEWFRDMGASYSLLDRALELGKKAVALDPNDRLCHDALGYVYLHRKAFDLAEQHRVRALELNPNHPEQIARMGVLYTFLGRADEGIARLEQARQLDPYFSQPWRWNIRGVAHFIAHRYEDAIAAFSRSESTPVWAQVYLAACHALLGHMDQAREHAAEVRRRAPDFSLTRFADKEFFKRAEDVEHLIEGMRAAGLPE